MPLSSLGGGNVKTKPRSDGRRETWGEGPISTNKTLLVSARDYPGVSHCDPGCQFTAVYAQIRETVSRQRCTVICQELPRPELSYQGDFFISKQHSKPLINNKKVGVKLT